MPPTALPIEGAVDRLQRRFTLFQGQVYSAVRRARLFLWLCWGFLCATIIGAIFGAMLSALFPVITTSYTELGAVSTTSPPVWAIPVGMIPAAALLALAVLDIVHGRREIRTGAVRVRVSHWTASSPASSGWAEKIRGAQTLITRIRHDTNSGFVPLLLGGLLLDIFLGQPLLSHFARGSASYAIASDLLPIPALVLLLGLFLIARGWIRSYQMLLDRQATVLTGLASFLVSSRQMGVRPRAAFGG
jgi:hypothetical protein